jgi:hypothetical protein
MIDNDGYGLHNATERGEGQRSGRNGPVATK